MSYSSAYLLLRPWILSERVGWRIRNRTISSRGAHSRGVGKHANSHRLYRKLCRKLCRKPVGSRQFDKVSDKVSDKGREKLGPQAKRNLRLCELSFRALALGFRISASGRSAIQPSWYCPSLSEGCCVRRRLWRLRFDH